MNRKTAIERQSKDYEYSVQTSKVQLSTVENRIAAHGQNSGTSKCIIVFVGTDRGRVHQQEPIMNRPCHEACLFGYKLQLRRRILAPGVINETFK
jgi:hypothetical protein